MSLLVAAASPPSGPAPPPLDYSCLAERWGEGGSRFRGSVSTTASGLRCQPWHRQHPHKWHTEKPIGLGRDTPYVADYCRNVEPPTTAAGAAVDPGHAPQGPWCFTLDDGVRFEVCDVCGAAARLWKEVEAPHVHPFVPEWAGPLCFAFSLVALVVVLLLGLARHFEVDLQSYFDFFGERARGAGSMARMARPRARPAPAPGAGPGAGGPPPPGGLPASMSLGACHGAAGVAPLVAPAAPGGSQEETFSALAGLASFQQQRQQQQPPPAAANPMAASSAEQRRAAAQGLLANDAASMEGSVLNAPPVLGPDSTAPEPRLPAVPPPFDDNNV